jgi:hypothetical protein
VMNDESIAAIIADLWRPFINPHSSFRRTRMFQLHDKTRRRIALAAFVAAGVLPLLLIAGWCLNRHLPGCAQAEADALGRQLGLVVKIDAVRHLRPGVVLYEGIELADPETGQTMLRSRCLEIAWRRQADGQGQLRPTLCVIASQPEVETATIGVGWRWVQRLLENSPGRSEANVLVSADAVTLRAGDRSQTMSEVAALLEALPNRTSAQIDFRLVGADTPEPARIRIVRNREVSPPASRFELTTGDGELPCSVLALAIDELKPLGPRCRFYGQVWANETPDGWDGEVAGQLTDLDLGSLITDHFPHRLSGIGRVTNMSARFRRGRLEECCGVVAAERGLIGRSLVKAAVERLGLAAPESLPPGDRIAYRELAMSIVFDANGLRLRGLCSTGEPGTILSDGRNRLLGEPMRGSQPMAALVQMLVPQSVVQVPASRQTDWLLRHLPVPDVLSPPGSEAVPTARVHLPDEWQR